MRTLMTAMAAASVVVLAGAGVATAAAPAAHVTAAKTSPCQPGTLAAHTVGDQYETSTFGTLLQVTNHGTRSCTVSGYAGLGLEGAGHKAVKMTVKHGSTEFTHNSGTRAITLKPGASAWADLAWTNTGDDSANAKYLQISPSGSNSHSTVAFSHLIDNGALTETAWSTSKPTIAG
ncbi:DUF4232 domain-containing protein [Streptantibioticus silvisoli]|uniref:DUF4232 domain-containing protein n=1 Tax=Streptantibioticus silvisoli TaxID=2705255 RepID=A0ABT6VY18_9ACTN|nr:DUF4232 domain-containing protein [Streptantibioticus silvisoli]MDI5962151.1 DUF4232 domain-containing protein [Streptantibioticus silvisoli]